MARVAYNDELSYELFEDGYDIYRKGIEGAWITQRVPYNRVYKADGTDEENCLIQLEELTAPAPEPEEIEEMNP